jgi:hypothetical protein
MQDQKVDRNLKGMDDLDFDGWNKADWDGVFAHHHTDDVLVASRSTLPHVRLSSIPLGAPRPSSPHTPSPSDLVIGPVLSASSGMGAAW